MEDLTESETKAMMSSVIRDFEINGRSTLQPSHMDPFDSSSDHSEDSNTESLQRVLDALGRTPENRVSERGKCKYVIRRYGMTSFIYLVDSCKEGS